MAALEQRLDLKLDTKLVMTPQLQMAIKLLQMPAVELSAFIAQELTDNPFLQSSDGMSEQASSDVDDSHLDAADGLSQDTIGENCLDTDWDNMYDSGDHSAGGVSAASGDETAVWERTAHQGITLKQHLGNQIGMISRDPSELFLARYLIDSIDDTGYLRADLSNVAARLNVSLEAVEKALEFIHTLDPCGVGARDLAECLCLQLELESGLKGHKLQAAMNVAQNLELLASRDFKKLARTAGCSLEHVVEYCEIIRHLTPKPGLKYGSDVSDSVIPDVVVVKKDGLWHAELNTAAMPKVLVNKDYGQLLNKAKGDEKSYMNERVGRAQWLTKSLEQRARTIYAVSNAILAVQQDFLEYGLESLQPLTLKDVAAQVDVHESTVSRVTNGKFMQTPLGVFELKYFFSSGIGTTGGQLRVASESVRHMIKRLIDGEDPVRPLSDEKIVQLLKAEGVDVARRTVAKYREGLGILSSAKRKIRAS